MIREIEFRAKTLWRETDRVPVNCNHKDGDWAYGDLHLRCKRPHIHAANDERVPIDADSIGQFTGMCDSNGNKIYEGDIVKVVDVFSSAETSYIGFVDFRRGMWSVITYSKPLRMWVDRALYNHSLDGKNATVIGNMTDTPELVNQLNS